MLATIDLNADVGEGALFDDAILSLVTSANVSCGAHAGDESTIAAALESARRYGVTVGAHPGFADRGGYGRGAFERAIDEAFDSLVEQMRQLGRTSRELGVPLRYVKPHGALYHLVSRDDHAASVFLEAISHSLGPLPVLVPPAAALAHAATAGGIRAFAEGFADRAYAPDGTLVARDAPGALVSDPRAAARQAVSLAVNQRVRASDGTAMEHPCDSICIHGDGPSAVEIASEVRAGLARAGVRVHPFTPR
jgi:5-oxoprolinase (ATP-hydrolysing) subunit A